MCGDLTIRYANEKLQVHAGDATDSPPEHGKIATLHEDPKDKCSLETEPFFLW